MAKACEIAARGRCTDLSDDGMGAGDVNGRGYSDGFLGTTPRTTERRRSWNYGGTRPKSNSSSTSSRFNIEVDEVPAVRSTVSSWKQSPHAPLRLDIYYEHDSSYDEQHAVDGWGERAVGANDAADPPPPPPLPQRELLERWCIDYVPSSSSNSNSFTSPYNSPSSSSHSSRILTGSFVSGSGDGKSSGSGMSQLRRVCKRIVVLLRSLHCLTRMLPSYRLKCLLLSNMAHGGGITASNGLAGGMAAPSQAAMGGIATAAGADCRGWGSIGYSIHAGDPGEQGEPPLPSPSFARQAFPNVPTPYGNLCLSVLYDATLNPNHMVADLAERRAEWVQRLWAARAQPQYEPRHQQYMPGLHAEQPPVTGAVILTSTRPIPIDQAFGQQDCNVNDAGVSRTTAPLTVNNNQSDKARSCPPAQMAFMGGPASFGSVGPRTRAVSDFIIKDYHNSPKLKPISHSPTDNISEGGNGMEGQRVMSGLSLAMMNEEANGSPAAGQSPGIRSREGQRREPVDRQFAHSTSPHEYGRYCEQHNVPPPSFGSPATRAAFHNPPPLYSPGSDVRDDRDHLGGTGTHFFQKHGGYGYGYNGSNVQFGDAEPPLPLQPSMNTPPTPQRDLLPRNYSPSRSPSLTRKNSSDYGRHGSDPPPFVNGPPFQPHLTPKTAQRSGTPPTAFSLSASGRQNPIGSPLLGSKGGLAPDGRVSDSVPPQQRSRSRASSSHQSTQLLAPVTSLDVLQKSPFLALAASVRRGGTKAPAGGEEGGASNQNILGSCGDDDGALPSSIPEMGSIGVSTLGGGSSNNAEGSNSTATGQRGSTDSSDRKDDPVEAARPAEELPFAVDDDVPTPALGAASPAGPTKDGSRSSPWGSTRADVLGGTIGDGGDGGGGIPEIASTLAVSSLHHRCAADGKVRLKMFDSVRTVESSGEEGRGGDPSPATRTASTKNSGDFDAIQDQLSEFRSFRASLMVDNSTNGSQTE